MRATLNVVAVCILLAAVTWWWQAGLNKGWTKTSVQIMKFDEITEISYPQNEKRFVPGVDILAAAAFVSALLVGGTFLMRKRGKYSRTK